MEASLYEISNGGGLRVLLTDYGASVVSIFVTDKDGNERDVILGYDLSLIHISTTPTIRPLPAAVTASRSRLSIRFR